MPGLSIVMSVFNDQKYLRQAIDSILCQDYADFEFIIVDDGSEDASREILRAYRDERIRHIREENSGLTQALKRAMVVGNSEFVARMDADDVSLPQRLGAQIAFLRGHPDVGLVGTQAFGIDEAGNVLGYERLPTESSEIEKVLRHSGNCIIHGTIMLRRSAYDAVGGYRSDFELAQDYDLVLRLGERYRVSNLPDFHYQLRIRPDSVSGRRHQDQVRFAKLARALAHNRREGLPENLQVEKRAVFGARQRRWRLQKPEELIGALLCAYGVTYLNCGRPLLAREALRKSLRKNPASTKAAVLYLLTYLPAGVRMEFRRAYQLLRHGTLVTPELRH